MNLFYGQYVLSSFTAPSPTPIVELLMFTSAIRNISRQLFLSNFVGFGLVSHFLFQNTVVHSYTVLVLTQS